MIHITRPQIVARKMFIGTKIIGYCLQLSTGEWKAVLFHEGPQIYGVHSRSCIVQRENDIVLFTDQFSKIQALIEAKAFDLGWI